MKPTYSVLLFGIALVLGINAVAAESPECQIRVPPIQPRLIPGTDLFTHTFYKLGLKRFPGGIITWTEQGTKTFNFVQIDNDSEHWQKYLPGEEWYNDTMWEFVPAYSCGNDTGWFTLVNRGRPGYHFTWLNKSYMDGAIDQFHIILSNSFYGRNKTELLVKPVKVDSGDGSLYQLKFALKDGFVTWTEKKYGDRGSHFIQVDAKEDRERRQRYTAGDWKEDTWFSVEPITGEGRLGGGEGYVEVGESCCFMKVELEKIRVKIGNLTDFIEDIEFGPNEIAINNGPGILKKEYATNGKVIEEVLAEKIESVSGIKMGFEIEFEEVEKVSGFLKGRITETLRKAYEGGNVNVKELKEHVRTQAVEIPPCTEYELRSLARVLKNLKVEYEAFVKVSGRLGDARMSESEVRGRLPDDLEYLEERDQYTVQAVGRGKAVMTIVIGTVLDGKGRPIENCNSNWNSSPPTANF